MRSAGWLLKVRIVASWWTLFVVLFNISDRKDFGYAWRVNKWTNLNVFHLKAVCWYASQINDESKKPLQTLQSVHSDYFDVTMKRFTEQLSGETVALSGMNFFYLTRKLILSVSFKEKIFNAFAITSDFDLSDFRNYSHIWTRHGAGQRSRTGKVRQQSLHLNYVVHRVLYVRRFYMKAYLKAEGRKNIFDLKIFLRCWNVCRVV